jgi:hypothetical protein
MRARLLLLVALGVSGCALRPGAGPPSLDTYADRGPLPVRGAYRWAPGPTIYRALKADAVPQLAGRGEPDTVEVVNGRGRGQRVVFTYLRARGGVARRIVLKPSRHPRDKRSQYALPASSRPVRRRVVARSRPPDTPTPAPSEPSTAEVAKSEPSPANTALTARQALECPIDAERADCRSICADGADYEWCR